MKYILLTYLLFCNADRYYYRWKTFVERAKLKKGATIIQGRKLIKGGNY